MFDLSQLNFSQDDGFVSVVAQDAASGLVLMVGRADRDSIAQTLATGDLHCHVRLDGRWRSNAGGPGHRIVSLACDCDGDALLARVVPAGPACHTGAPSCFSHPEDDENGALAEGASTGTVGAAPRRRLRELGDDAVDAITDSARRDVASASAEVADLVYRALGALCEAGGSLSDVQRLLGQRPTPAGRPMRPQPHGR